MACCPLPPALRDYLKPNPFFQKELVSVRHFPRKLSRWAPFRFADEIRSAIRSAYSLTVLHFFFPFLNGRGTIYHPSCDDRTPVIVYDLKAQHPLSFRSSCMHAVKVVFYYLSRNLRSDLLRVFPIVMIFPQFPLFLRSSGLFYAGKIDNFRLRPLSCLGEVTVLPFFFFFLLKSPLSSAPPKDFIPHRRHCTFFFRYTLLHRLCFTLPVPQPARFFHRIILSSILYAGDDAVWVLGSFLLMYSGLYLSEMSRLF